MAYSSDSDLLKEFSTEELARLTGDPTGTTIDTDRTTHARTNADAMIDAYLHGRYTVPFESPVDLIINKISVDLTVVNLYDYAYRDSSVPNTVVWRRIYGLKLLKDIQKGYVSIQNASHGTNAPPPLVSNKSEQDRFFGDEVLDQFWD